MQRNRQALWQDEAGFVVSASWPWSARLPPWGMVTGLAEASSNVHNELHDVGAAVGSLDQSFSFKKTNGEVVSFVDSDHR